VAEDELHGAQARGILGTRPLQIGFLLLARTRLVVQRHPRGKAGLIGPGGGRQREERKRQDEVFHRTFPFRSTLLYRSAGRRDVLSASAIRSKTG